MGREEAQQDIRAGKLAERIYGLAFQHDPIYEDLLQKRFGIQLERVAMCAVGEDLAMHIASYNSTMRKEIERRFGVDVLEKTMNEAQRIWKESHPGEQ